MAVIARHAFGLLILAAQVFAHIIMKYPIPIGNPTNSPLDNAARNAAADTGTFYPCHITSAATYKDAQITTITSGSQLNVSFLGSAVHGGGSCQFSLSKDLSPTTNSTFKVIHSVEGGCPARGISGNFPEDDASYEDPSQYPVSFPSTLAVGRYTFAWTWFNKVGNREMYMNCAAIEITSVSSDGTTDTNSTIDSGTDSYFDSLPDTVIANTDADDCKSVDETSGVSFKYAYPGVSLEINEEIDDKYMVLPQCRAGGETYSVAASATTATSNSLTSNTGTIMALYSNATSVAAVAVESSATLRSTTMTVTFANTTISTTTIPTTSAPAVPQLPTSGTPSHPASTGTLTSPSLNTNTNTNTSTPSTNTSTTPISPSIWGKALGMPNGTQVLFHEVTHRGNDSDINTDMGVRQVGSDPVSQRSEHDNHAGFRQHVRHFLRV